MCCTWHWNVRLEKSWPNIWWIGKVDVPLHSQLKRTGFRKCLSLMSGEQVFDVKSIAWRHLYIIRCKTHERGAQKKTSPKIWWIQKVVVPLHSQPQRKGVGSVRRTIGVWLRWQLIETLAESMWWLACQVDLEAQWSACSYECSSTDKNDRRKKLLQIFGGFKNLSYLCTHNPQEKADRSSQVKRHWSGALKRATLTGIIEAIFDIFHN